MSLSFEGSFDEEVSQALEAQPSASNHSEAEVQRATPVQVMFHKP